MRCIAKDPNERYTTMDAVLQAIKQAHGVSMTGQLAAVNVSGAYMPVQTHAPPAVHSSHPGLSGRIPAMSSGSHTPMGMLSAGGTGESGVGGPYSESAPHSRRASKAWIGVGVLVAAALGGVLGMAAFRMTASSASTTTQPRASAEATSSAPATSAVITAATAPSSAATTSAGAAPDARTATLKVTTDPPGASVREDAIELCAATPCDVTFKGDAADPAKVHKLVFTHLAFGPRRAA